MLRIVLLRHAPTTANDTNVFMGRSDPPNTDEGLGIAHNLTNLPKPRANVFLFTSPLLRSRATLDAIYPEGQRTIDERLVERALGSWEGRTLEDVRQCYPQAFRSGGDLDIFFTPPEGEPIDLFVDRICAFMIDMCRFPANSTVVVVTHRGVIGVIRSLIEERRLRECYSEIEPFLTPRSYQYAKDRTVRLLKQARKILDEK